MNVDNGHLVRPHLLDEMSEDERKKYEPVPSHLDLIAQLELMGKNETYVGKNASGSLSKHMRIERNKRKKKRQLAKISRRKNKCRC